MLLDSVLTEVKLSRLVTSIFSAGNTYTYCATRSLYGMALESRAPKFLRYVIKSGPMAGVPILCLAVTMVFPCLSFLQVSNGSNVVLQWLTNLVTAGGVITYIVMAVTYIFFYRAVTAQGLDRRTFPYVSLHCFLDETMDHDIVSH